MEAPTPPELATPLQPRMRMAATIRTTTQPTLKLGLRPQQSTGNTPVAALSRTRRPLRAHRTRIRMATRSRPSTPTLHRSSLVATTSQLRLHPRLLRQTAQKLGLPPLPRSTRTLLGLQTRVQAHQRLSQPPHRLLPTPRRSLAPAVLEALILL